MASIKLKFRTSSVQEKEGRLYYQVIHNRVARQIHTEYRIYSSEWDADHSNIILPTSVTPQRQETAVGHCTVGQGRAVIYSRHRR